MKRVYVAAPYDEAPLVRNVHDQFRRFGVQPTSKWAESADGPENFAKYSPLQLRQLALSNDADLMGSHACLVLAHHGKGGEMWCEMTLARVCSIPVVYVGDRRILSAYRIGIEILESIEIAVPTIAFRLNQAAWEERREERPR